MFLACSRCGLGIEDPTTKTCPKCDSPIRERTNGKKMQVDVAHSGEDLDQALRKYLGHRGSGSRIDYVLHTPSVRVVNVEYLDWIRGRFLAGEKIKKPVSDHAVLRFDVLPPPDSGPVPSTTLLPPSIAALGLEAPCPYDTPGPKYDITDTSAGAAFGFP